MKAKSCAVMAILAFGSLSWMGGVDRVDAARYRRSAAVVPAGSTISVRIDEKISTEDADEGDTWNGTLNQSVHSDGRVVIPAGSPVTGVVTMAAQGTHSSRPRLDLAVREVTIDGRTYDLNARTEPIIGGSKRAKKIGAIAGGAVAGGLLGHLIGGKKGAVIGGVAGGAAGYGLTRNALRTLQIKSGTVVQFTTRQELVARRY